MVAPRTERSNRVTVLSVSYAALVAISIFDYFALHIHVGVVAVIPLLFIAYYARPPVALTTAAVSGALISLLDRDEIPGGTVW